MTTSPRNHAITIVEEATRELIAWVTEEGDIEAGPVIDADISDQYLQCSVCGSLGADEWEDHGISDAWQVF